MTPYIEAKKAEARERIVRCEQPPKDRGVLLSNPPQYRCERPGCRKTWVVGDTPPVCDMFDVEKHSDWLADTLLNEIQEAVKLPEKSERTLNDYEAGYEQGWNQREYKLEENFQHLRTGVTE